LFIIAILLGSSGFATTLTLVSGIASKVPGNNTLMAILSIPIIIPLLLMLIRLSKNAIDGLDWSVSMDEITILSALNVLSCALSYILFPYLWKS
jgi:heme exporter protein B